MKCMEYLNYLQTYQLLKDDYFMQLAGLYSYHATAHHSTASSLTKHMYIHASIHTDL